MTLIRWYKNLAIVGVTLWAGLGVITVGSIALSFSGWVINLFMGVLFIFIGVFLYLRADSLYKTYSSITVNTQGNPHIRRFLLLDLIFMSGVYFVGGAMLIASIHRVFSEGFAVFG